MEIKEIHEQLLSLMKKFDGVCRENEIKYTLHGGTLLGAVREHGFIPWDDDLDVTMTRAEFNKLSKVLDGSGELVIRGTIKKQVVAKTDDRFWVDIFILDPISENSSEAHKKLNMLTIYEVMSKDREGLKLVNFKRYSKSKQIVYRLVYLAGRFVPQNYKLKKYDEIARLKWCGNGSFEIRSNDQFVGRKIIMPKEWMNEYIDIDFESERFMASANYHDILVSSYGEDYMTPKQDTRNADVHEIVRQNKVQ